MIKKALLPVVMNRNQKEVEEIQVFLLDLDLDRDPDRTGALKEVLKDPLIISRQAHLDLHEEEAVTTYLGVEETALRPTTLLPPTLRLMLRPLTRKENSVTLHPRLGRDKKGRDRKESGAPLTQNRKALWNQISVLLMLPLLHLINLYSFLFHLGNKRESIEFCMICLPNYTTIAPAIQTDPEPHLVMVLLLPAPWLNRRLIRSAEDHPFLAQHQLDRHFLDEITRCLIRTSLSSPVRRCRTT